MNQKLNSPNPDPLFSMRHSTEHVLTQAMQNLYPGQFLMAMGPATEDGFYFDFQPVGDFKVNEEMFPTIEAEMSRIIQQDLPITKSIVTKEEAEKLFAGNTFKLEWVNQFASQGQELTIYKTADQFTDLCAGPHVESTGKIGAFKLLSVAGAYWHGDEKNPMLTRIYGTTYPTQKELDEYLLMQEEVKKRDHKRLGRELELFMFHETAPGMPYWLPKGMALYNQLIEFWRQEHLKHNYQEICSPLINKVDLWKTSGHWEHYKEDMFISDMGEHEVYGIKPMNCPNAMLVFGSQGRSYRDLPLRLSDTDRLHRYERSGTLNGLLRVRSFQQDDSHNFVTEDQVASEYEHIFQLCEKFYGIFGLEYSFRLGTRPEKFLGEQSTWDKAESALRSILEKSGKKYLVKEGDGAFYGPKVDILMKDALGREWQMGTIQLDFQLPQRFGLEYTDSDGKKKTPVVVHRVIYGSLERFIGLIIEHFAGAFPIWLSPVQVSLIPISDDQVDYAQTVKKTLDDQNIRVEIQTSGGTMQNKIKLAQEQKIPFMLILGKKEQEASTVSVRQRDGQQINALPLADFQEKLLGLISKKSLYLLQ